MSEHGIHSWVNGKPCDTVPTDDRGLLYGESVFETMAARDGMLPLWPLHWQRLQQAVAALGWPAVDRALLESELATALPRSGKAMVRLTLTAGSGGQGYWSAEQTTLRRIIRWQPWPDRIERARAHGLRCTVQQGDYTAPLRGHKHGNRLAQVLAAKQAGAENMDEALLANTDGQLLEGISANVIVVLSNQAFTPPGPMVDGVGLAWLCAQCPDIGVKAIKLDELKQASEVVMVNSVAGVRPVVWLNGQALSIGSHCSQWQQLWRQHLV